VLVSWGPSWSARRAHPTPRGWTGVDRPTSALILPVAWQLLGWHRVALALLVVNAASYAVFAAFTIEREKPSLAEGLSGGLMDGSGR
jgi:hypothetical protein